MLLGYNTNGLSHHDLLDAIRLLAEIGYRGVAITIDHGTLNPYDQRTEGQLEAVAALLDQRKLACVIETGARFLLDRRTKHEPTLVTADAEQRERRIDYLCRAIDIAARLNARCVSLWSGIVRDGAGERESFARLAGSLTPVIDHALRRQVQLAFEPEPGMLVDTLARYDELVSELDSRRVDPSPLGLTIDIGHLHCQGETPIAEHLLRYKDQLAHVHIEDMRAGVHDHLMFGEGEIDFRPVIAALAKIGYAGMIAVELSRHSHEGPAAALRAYNFLMPLLGAAGGDRAGEAPAEP
jgi:L-ribulose-5-phosphate 3-epimerase